MKCVCPMHPKVSQDKPGKCYKCGEMELVPEDTLKKSEQIKKSKWKDYLPLITIISLISLVTVFITIKDYYLGSFAIKNTLSYFMIGFFITFAGFKLIDLKGFAEGYAKYDILAKHVFSYGYIYPFIELSFGLGMILLPESFTLLLAEFLLMTFSGLGVLIKLTKKEQFQCACLGTFLKVPLTKITLIEDFGMAFLALIVILL